MRILLTSAGGELMPVLAKYLKNDIYLKKPLLYGVDQRKIKKSKYFEKIYLLSSKNRSSFKKKILKICQNNKINLIIPFSDEEARIFSHQKNFFLKKKIKIMVNDSKVVELISNKFKTYELLRKNKIRIPEYYLSKNMKSLEKNIKKFKEKKNNFVIKPLNSRGGRGIIICSYNATNTNKYKPKRIKLVNYNNLKLNKSIFKFGDVLVMEQLMPPGYDIDCYVQNKKIFNIFRKRVNPYGIPYKGNIFVKPKKNFNLKKIIKVLKLKSLFDLDFFTNQRGYPVLLEANPRPSGSITLCNKIKIPFLSFAISKFMNIYYPSLKLSINSKKIIK